MVVSISNSIICKYIVLILFFYSFQEISRLYFNFHKQPPQKTVRKLLRTDSIKEGIKAGFV